MRSLKVDSLDSPKTDLYELNRGLLYCRWILYQLIYLGSPIFPLGCEGKLGVALESLQGLRDLT